MDFAEVIRRRRMVRDYSDRPLSDEVVERVLNSALRAPSAGFSQGWAFPPQGPRVAAMRRGADEVIHRGQWGRQA